MDLRAIQAPIKDRYKSDPESALFTLTAEARHGEASTACSVDIGRAIFQAQAHAGVGGSGTAACSGDMLLAALAACAQITCQMVAESSGIPVQRVDVTVEGDLDLRGTLGVARKAPVGFASIRLHFDIAAPDATDDQLARLNRATEAYCTVLQTLLHPPAVEATWERA